MNPEPQYRYPGLEPFSPAQKAQFFGRTADLSRLLEMVQTHQQVLLYAKSGLGKSSLINAGLVPCLAASSTAEIIPIRIGAYLNNQSPSPLEAVHGALSKTSTTLIDRIIHQEGSLWYHFKANTLRSSEPKIYYLLFDQFEEIFSHPNEHIFAFKKQMADLLYRVVPQHFKSVLEIRQRENPHLLSVAEWNQLFQPMEIKVLYAIREDRYSELNRLADYLPDLLHYRYQLGPLNREQAEEAILRPAMLGGAFLGPAFRYTDVALTRILDYLTGDQQQPVETTQLQILCNHIERLQKNIITAGDIPEFDNIFLQFYDESMACLEGGNQTKARTFIETKMIIHGQRIAYHRLACLENIPEEALDTLLRERHLLRTERSSTGGISYELSHDTLVAPILLARERREGEEAMELREIEAQQLREQAASERLAKIKARRRLRYASVMLVIAIAGVVIASAAFFYASIKAQEAKKSAKEMQIAKTESEALRTQAENNAKILQSYINTEVRNLIRDATIFTESNSIENAKRMLRRAHQLDPQNTRVQQLLEEMSE